MGIGSAVAELLIFTRPTDAIDALARYREGDLAPRTARIQPVLVAAPGAWILGASAAF
jgi:hypothetical protein